ncbi:MAG: plasmid recombination protein [Oscillospiraceae bacterium]|nr:plasmid recombination protein [Oscillospiraceae bacterium]
MVRNQAYRWGEFNIRERHNERKNVSYGNGDILPERFAFNVHFKSCTGAYEQEFNRMVDDGTISLRGLKADAKVFDELVFDVNTAYFENNGGYDYAKEFFEEAYKLAIKEAGGEEYILSAVLHADERNKALSEQFEYDVFHYHLHVVYVPVVDKEVYFKKNNKNPELAGKLKEVIKQVSHSKKWPRFRDDNGRWVNSYSLLQDRFFEHSSTAEHFASDGGTDLTTISFGDTYDFWKKAKDEGRYEDEKHG